MPTVLTEKNVQGIIWNKSMRFFTVFRSQEFCIFTLSIYGIYRSTQIPLGHHMLIWVTGTGANNSLC